MVKATGEIALKHPTSFGVWLSVLFEMVQGVADMVALYYTYKILMSAATLQNEFYLLRYKWVDQQAFSYLSRHDACQQPVTIIEAF